MINICIDLLSVSRSVKKLFCRDSFNVAVLLVLTLILSNSTTVAQDNDYQPIDFSVSDVSISTALVQLAMKADFNFSFNSDDESLNKTISYSANDRSPLAILDDLLSKTDHSYKIIGKQVVIYMDPDKIDESKNDEVVVPVPQVITKYITNNVYDTITISDTIIKSDTVVKIVVDTLVRVDTLRLTDTVFLEKEKPKKQSAKIKDIPVDYFNKQASRENGFAMGFSAAPILSDFSLVEGKNDMSIRNFSLGVSAYRLSKSWAFSGGIKFTNFAEKYDHMYEVKEGGFWDITYEEYYSISHGDTSFFYVPDSNWVPLSTSEYNYDINNRIGLLEISATAYYYLYTTSKFRYYLRAGGQISFLLYKKGIAIPEPGTPSDIPFSDLNFAIQSFSILAGTGFQYRLNKYFDFNIEVYYVHYLNDLVKDYPTSIRLKGVGLKVGLIYFF